MKIRICSLFSGSSGNSTLIRIDDQAILIDAGCGIVKMKKALAETGTSFEQIKAIFISHEHVDHINGLKSILKKYSVPVIANKNTLDAIQEALYPVEARAFIEMEPGSIAESGYFKVKSVKTYHDAVNSVCYFIQTPLCKIGIITDTGKLDQEIADEAAGCNVLILEANHDYDMLWGSTYPYYLKHRIAGDFGHLSNNQAADFISGIYTETLKDVLFAHLSEENNSPTLALHTIGKYLERNGIRLYNERRKTGLRIDIAPRNDISRIIEYADS